MESNASPNISRTSDSFSTVEPIVHGVHWDALRVTWRLMVIAYDRNRFHSPKVTPLTNLAEVTVQGLCYYNSNALGWHNR